MGPGHPDPVWLTQPRGLPDPYPLNTVQSPLWFYHGVKSLFITRFAIDHRRFEIDSDCNINNYQHTPHANLKVAKKACGVALDRQCLSKKSLSTEVCFSFISLSVENIRKFFARFATESFPQFPPKTGDRGGANVLLVRNMCSIKNMATGQNRLRGG